MENPTQTCSQCAHFDGDPDMGAGFCEVEMSYRPDNAPICEEFVLPATDTAE